MSTSIVDLRRSFFGAEEQEVLQDFYDQGVTAADLLDLVVNPATGGDLELIGHQVLASPAASVVFSSIPATYQHLKAVIQGRSARVNTTEDLLMRLNADTGANYDYQMVNGANTTVTGLAGTGQTSAAVGNLPAANATANNAGQCIVDIAGYTSALFKTYHSRSIDVYGTTAGDKLVQNVGGLYRSTTAISTVTFILSAGSNFVAGSMFSLYGMKGS